MTPDQKVRALLRSNCHVATDDLTRQLHATDASIYQIEPLAVAFPRNAAEASSVIRAAAEVGVPVTPRGAGTGLVGGAIGDGVVIDLARHNQQITDLNIEKRTVRVGAGVVLDQLNQFLRPHGFRFGPDVATSSRATLGGMIGNNSSGSHVPVYGTTVDHVLSMEVVLPDGQVAEVGLSKAPFPCEPKLASLLESHAPEIARRMPPGLQKRWPGYGFDKYLAHLDNLTALLTGSEGTLAAMISAEVRIVPVPTECGIGLIFFDSVAEAMQATVELLDLHPAAIEHVDRVLFDQTKGQLQFQAARDLLQLDAKPCESILIVEFFDHVEEKLERLGRRPLGRRIQTHTGAREMNLVWNLRKAGLSLLTGRKGRPKPVTGIEDTAVRPADLPAYVDGLQKIMTSLGLEACYYGHAATGLLHLRPVLDLQTPDDLKKFRQVCDDVSALVRQFKGSLAAEHGVGIARTEYLGEQVGPELLELHRQVKSTFDPKNQFNPGKLIPDGRYKIDQGLRWNSGEEMHLPFEPFVAFAAKDESFVLNLEQCNGCGGCRKLSPTMCPTFLATGDELMSTRGRANVIRAALDGRFGPASNLLECEELEQALSSCLSCKACTVECPSNVNMALLKAELWRARRMEKGSMGGVRTDGTRARREWLLSSPDLLGRIGSAFPGLTNALLRQPSFRRILSAATGLDPRRPLPSYAEEPFHHWFAQRARQPVGGLGEVFLWDDTFARFHEPSIARAATRVLEAAGYTVRLVHRRVCCGRPAFSQGDLDKAARLGRENIELILHQNPRGPVIFLEPSCYSMFAEDYRELNLPGASQLSGRCYLFEQFMDDLLQRDPSALPLQPPKGESTRVTIHAHCHAKSLTNPGYMARLARTALGCATPGSTPKVTLLESGCCGMAGGFGLLESKYDLSVAIAQPLLEQIRRQPPGKTLIASGTSCRHQIEDLAGVRALHMAEWLAGLLAPSRK